MEYKKLRTGESLKTLFFGDSYILCDFGPYGQLSIFN